MTLGLPNESETGASTIDVTCEAGTFRGIRSGSLSTFRGIPYAEPPSGALRFQAPQRRAPQDSVVDATKWGATPQKYSVFADPIVPEPTVDGDDILNLNIFTRTEAIGFAGLPVLVWIHGGGYRGGSSSGEWYDGRSFVRDGVIVVSISYRLAFDGFGLVDGGATNRGMRDWIAALEWVQENIAAFGGDPARVTIAGQSAGGGAVLALAASPAAHGLFSQVWSLSATVATTTKQHLEQYSTRFAEALGVTPTVEGFGRFSDAELQRAGIELMPIALDAMGQGPADNALPLVPMIGDHLLPWQFASGSAESSAGGGSRMLIGSTADEFTAPGGAMPPIGHDEVLQMLASWGVSIDRAEQYLERRAADVAGELTGSAIVTDVLFRSVVPAVVGTRAAVAAAPTWAYHFGWQSTVTGLSGHCFDIPYFFDVLDAPTPHVARHLGAANPDLADTMHRDAVAFIAGGDLPWAPVTSAEAANQAGEWMPPPARLYGIGDPATVETGNAYAAVAPLAGIWAEEASTSPS